MTEHKKATTVKSANTLVNIYNRRTMLPTWTLRKVSLQRYLVSTTDSRKMVHSFSKDSGLEQTPLMLPCYHANDLFSQSWSSHATWVFNNTQEKWLTNRSSYKPDLWHLTNNYFFFDSHNDFRWGCRNVSHKTTVFLRITGLIRTIRLPEQKHKHL